MRYNRFHALREEGKHSGFVPIKIPPWPSLKGSGNWGVGFHRFFRSESDLRTEKGTYLPDEPEKRWSLILAARPRFPAGEA